MSKAERTSLVTTGKRPRVDLIYETLMGLVVLGAAGWILLSIRDAIESTEISEGTGVLIQVAAWIIVPIVGAVLALQILALNGRFGVLYGVRRGDEVYLAAPEGLVGFASKRLACSGTVEIGVRTDDRSRGSTSTPATRVLAVCGDQELRVQVSAPIEDLGAVRASIRSWLESNGVKVKEIRYRGKNPAPSE